MQVFFIFSCFCVGWFIADIIKDLTKDKREKKGRDKYYDEFLQNMASLTPEEFEKVIRNFEEYYRESQIKKNKK